ncbi:MAG: DUF4430 domain-containing protein [Candidatus Kerfeldbacteria bacterium]|nr:DUF4430 domain-containing protein [Candidatus Kerfeldbacteria bacterium]
MNYKQKSIYIIVGLLALVGVFLLGASYGPSLFKEPAKLGEITENYRAVTVLIDDGQQIKSFKAGTLAQEQSVLDSLLFVTGENKLKLDYTPASASPMGAFIKQIGEEVNGFGGKYWQYWVNGSQPMVAADKFMLKGGETVLWTFRKSAL